MSIVKIGICLYRNLNVSLVYLILSLWRLNLEHLKRPPGKTHAKIGWSKLDLYWGCRFHYRGQSRWFSENAEVCLISKPGRPLAWPNCWSDARPSYWVIWGSPRACTCRSTWNFVNFPWSTCGPPEHNICWRLSFHWCSSGPKLWWFPFTDDFSNWVFGDFQTPGRNHLRL